MPTPPQIAHEFVDDLSRPELIERALNMLKNTCPFDVTGHLALSVSSRTSDGLPVGLMLVGEWFNDRRVLQVDHTFETLSDWEVF